MSFWVDDFWAPKFWEDDFWEGMGGDGEPTEGQKNGGAPHVLPYSIPVRRKKLLTETPLGLCMLAVGAGVVR